MAVCAPMIVHVPMVVERVAACTSESSCADGRMCADGRAFADGCTCADGLTLHPSWALQCIYCGLCGISTLGFTGYPLWALKSRKHELSYLMEKGNSRDDTCQARVLIQSDSWTIPFITSEENCGGLTRMGNFQGMGN
eukprot:1081541-Pelagomonas_calceolata.AAC.1